jgi:hypothetical protein
MGASMLRTTACIASLVGALVLATPAVAASNGNGGGAAKSSSISLAQPSAATAAAVTGPGYGDLVSFDISTNETATPFVNVNCYQNGALVSEGWEGYFDGALGDRYFGLYSPVWTGGAADCTASLDSLVNGRFRVLASTSFHVDA